MVPASSATVPLSTVSAFSHAGAGACAAGLEEADPVAGQQLAGVAVNVGGVAMTELAAGEVGTFGVNLALEHRGPSKVGRGALGQP
eukprot:255271-Pyramimonas_sp.AAC.1